MCGNAKRIRANKKDTSSPNPINMTYFLEYPNGALCNIQKQSIISNVMARLMKLRTCMSETTKQEFSVLYMHLIYE